MALEDIFPQQTEDEVYNMFLEDLLPPTAGGSWNTRPGSVIHTLLQPLVLERLRLISYVQDTAASGFLRYAVGEALDAKGVEYGLARAVATKATVTLTFAGTNGTFIPLGAKFATLGDANTGDEGVEFETTASGTITGGTLTLTATSVDTGAHTNVDSSTIVAFVDIITGLTSVTNVDAATGGSDDQDDVEYRTALIARATRIPSGGNVSFYQAIAFSNPNIGVASVQDLWLGAGTGRLIVGGLNTIYANKADVDALQLRIDPSVKTICHFEGEDWKGQFTDSATSIEGRTSKLMTSPTDFGTTMTLAQPLDLSYWSATSNIISWYIRQECPNANISAMAMELLHSTSPLFYYNNFSTDNLSTDFAFDSGTGTAAISGGVLTVSDTTNKRIYYNGTNANRTGDVGFKYFKHTTGTSTTGYETGHIIKRIDANNYIKVCVEPGTIRISKVVAGTPTSLNSAAITALSTSTNYWISVEISGNIITAKHWTSAPTLTGSPATTVSHTLAGGDATQFGTGVRGHHGLFWTPGQAAATIDDYYHDPTIDGASITPAGAAITAVTGGPGGTGRFAAAITSFGFSSGFTWATLSPSIGFIQYTVQSTTSGSAVLSFDSLRIHRAAGGAGTGDAPIGTQITVASVAPTAIQVSAQITPNTGVSLTDIQDGIIEDIKRAVEEIPPNENIVRLSLIANAIHDYPGVLDYTNVQIARVGQTLAASNLTLNAGERAEATTFSLTT